MSNPTLIEELEKTVQGLALVRDNLAQANKVASAVESLVLSPILVQVVEAEQKAKSLLFALTTTE